MTWLALKCSRRALCLPAGRLGHLIARSRSPTTARQRVPHAPEVVKNSDVLFRKVFGTDTASDHAASQTAEEGGETR